LAISDWALIVRAFDVWRLCFNVCPFIKLLDREMNALATLMQDLDNESLQLMGT